MQGIAVLGRSRVRLVDQVMRIAGEIALDVGIANDSHIGDYLIAPDGEVEDLDAAHAGEPVPTQDHLAVKLPAARNRGQKIIPSGVVF